VSGKDGLLAGDLEDSAHADVSGGVGGAESKGVFTLFQRQLDLPSGGASGSLEGGGAEAVLDRLDTTGIAGGAFENELGLGDELGDLAGKHEQRYGPIHDRWHDDRWRWGKTKDAVVGGI
jgi:hypothetical protein